MPPELGDAMVKRAHAVAQSGEHEVVGHGAVACHAAELTRRRRVPRATSWGAEALGAEGLRAGEVPLALLGLSEPVTVDEAEELLDAGILRIDGREPLEHRRRIGIAAELVRDAHERQRDQILVSCRQRRLIGSGIRVVEGALELVVRMRLVAAFVIGACGHEELVGTIP